MEPFQEHQQGSRQGQKQPLKFALQGHAIASVADLR